MTFYRDCPKCGARGRKWQWVHAPDVQYIHITIFDCGSALEKEEFTQSGKCKSFIELDANDGYNHKAYLIEDKPSQP